MGLERLGWVEGTWELRRGTARESHATSRCCDALPDTLKRGQRATSSPSKRADIRVNSCPFVVQKIVRALAPRLLPMGSLIREKLMRGRKGMRGDFGFSLASSGAVGSMPPPTGKGLFRCCGVDAPYLQSRACSGAYGSILPPTVRWQGSHGDDEIMCGFAILIGLSAGAPTTRGCPPFQGDSVLVPQAWAAVFASR